MATNQQILYLNFLIKEHIGITKLITATKQRWGSLPGDMRDSDYDNLLKGEEVEAVGDEEEGRKEPGIETLKARANRKIRKELDEYWPIWKEWTKGVPGIGEYITAQLIMLFNYKFIAICKNCGGDLEKVPTVDGKSKMVCTLCKREAKKDGSLIYRIEEKDFPTVSKFWKYNGMHTENGIKPPLKKGVMAGWSTRGRTICYHIGEEINRQQADNPYKQLLNLRKSKHARNHKDWTLGHIHNAAKNEVAKIFLAHWYAVSRTLDGKPVTAPYAGVILGHTNIVQPFFYDGKITYVGEDKIAC